MRRRPGASGRPPSPAQDPPERAADPSDYALYYLGTRVWWYEYLQLTGMIGLIMAIIVFIATFSISVLYPTILGASLLVGLPFGFAMGLLFSVRDDIRAMSDRTHLYRRIGFDFVASLSCLCYFAFQMVILLRQCPDAAYLAAHPCVNEMCTDSTQYGLLITTIVVSAVLAAWLIVLVVGELSLKSIHEEYLQWYVRTLKDLRDDQQRMNQLEKEAEQRLYMPDAVLAKKK